jgi:membrane-associated phospholipid phosphatase
VSATRDSIDSTQATECVVGVQLQGSRFSDVLFRSADADPLLDAPRARARTRLAALPTPRHWILWSVLLTVAVLSLGFAVTSIRRISPTEVVVDQELSRDHDAVLTAIALAINVAFSPAGIVVVLACLFAVLLVLSRAPVNAVAVTLLAAAGWLSSEGFKLIVSRARLSSSLLVDPLVPESGWDSFPSGHTSFAVALAIALYLLARNTKWSTTVACAGVVFALAVGASRLYLGVHYPSDIAGAFLGPCAAIIFVSGLWNRYGLRVLGRVPLLARFGPIPDPPSPALASHVRSHLS